jgi:hypothetical protein
MGSGGEPRIYYLATNNHVCELAWGAGSWKHRDVTTFAPGLPDLPGGAVAVAIGANKKLRVYYLAVALAEGGSLGGVCELSWGGVISGTIVMLQPLPVPILRFRLPLPAVR